MKRLILNTGFRGAILLAVFALFMVSCNDDESPSIPSENTMLKFSVVVANELKIGEFSETDNKIKIKMGPDFDPALLKGLTPTIYISGYATVSPLPSEPQDFNNPVKYTVKGKDGATKEYIVEWTYGRRLEDGEGGGAMVPSWSKKSAELGLTAAIENSIGTIGDYLVFSRTHKAVNKLTGEVTDKKLNITGVPNQIFFLANDDAGNLIGSTLPALSGNKFNIYKWTSIDSDPILIYSEDYVAGTPSPGRKLDVAGDINGNAIITSSMFSGVSTGNFRRWKITAGGTPTEIASVKVPIGDEHPATATSIQWQSLAMSSADENSRFYATAPALLWGSIYSGIVVKYGKPSDPSLNLLRGSFVADDGSAGGGYFGNIVAGQVSSFNFNGKVYVAAVGLAWSRMSYCLVADDDIYHNSVGEKIGYWHGTVLGYGGGNQTTSITFSDEGDYALYYIFVEGIGVVCGKMTRYER